MKATNKIIRLKLYKTLNNSAIPRYKIWKFNFSTTIFNWTLNTTKNLTSLFSQNLLSLGPSISVQTFVITRFCHRISKWSKTMLISQLGCGKIYGLHSIRSKKEKCSLATSSKTIFSSPMLMIYRITKATINLFTLRIRMIKWHSWQFKR